MTAAEFDFRRFHYKFEKNDWIAIEKQPQNEKKRTHFSAPGGTLEKTLNCVNDLIGSTTLIEFPKIVTTQRVFISKLKEYVLSEISLHTQNQQEGVLFFVKWVLDIVKMVKQYVASHRFDQLLKKLDESKHSLKGLSAMCQLSCYEGVVEWLQFGADVHEKDASGFTPLELISASNGPNAARIAEKLLEAGAIPSSTALSSACTAENGTIALMLLEAGANPLIVESSSRMLLNVCKSGQPKMDLVALEFLEAGVSPDTRDDENHSALYWACVNRREALIEALAKQHATLTETDFGDHKEKNCTQYFLYLCCRSVDYAMSSAALLMAEVPEHAVFQDSNGFTALHFACMFGYREVASYLIQQQVYTNILSKLNRSPLYGACIAAHDQASAIALELIENGADIDVEDSNGCTALMIACEEEKSDVALKLIEKSANIFQSAKKDKRSALHLAAFSKKAEMVLVVDALIHRGVDVHAKDKYGLTALHVSCRFGHPEIVQSLYKVHKANIHARTNTNSTPLLSLCLSGNKEKERLALEFIADGADPTIVKQDGDSVIAVAARNGFTNLLEMLLTMNVDLHGVDSKGRTLLHYAFIHGMTGSYGHIAAELMYTFNQFDVARRDENGKTAWNYLENVTSDSGKQLIASFKTTEPLYGRCLWAFLTNNSNLLRETKDITRAQFEQYMKQIAIENPLTESASFTFSCLHSVDKSHFTKSLHFQPIPTEPAQSKIDDLLEMAKSVGITKEEDVKALRKYMRSIKTKRAMVGTPPSGDALIAFYRPIEQAVCHTLDALKQKSDKHVTETVLQEYVQAADLCGPRYHNTAVSQFYKVVHNEVASYETTVLKSLVQFRQNLLDTIVNQQMQKLGGDTQSVHAGIKATKELGKELGLPTGEALQSFDDMYSPARLNIDETRTLFLEKCTPQDILDWVLLQLKENESWRSEFVDFVKEHVPTEFVSEAGVERGYSYLESITDEKVISPMWIQKEAVITSLVQLGILTSL